MKYLDVYYRALRTYREISADNRDCKAFRRAVSQANTENDKIEISRNICIVDEDWIEAIEEGLVFVEKAIKEERQFIYSNGEVVPIEKVKHVSKDSVQHLAKHSNLITKEQETDDIVPDQLYSVERLNDYAVYENRFLYMLLCYLRDFITVRYDKILDLSNKYDGVLKLKKEIALPKRKITYSVDLHDEIKDDIYLRESNLAKNTIDRIDLMLKTVVAFLATPLMEVAGKAAKLKPPITKTNVLKMDNNFKGAVALYDFIIAYDKPGYTFECSTVDLAPFSDVLADELSEAGGILTFLTYEYGLGLNDDLKKRYIAEEERRKAEQIKQKAEQLELLKRKLANMEESSEEYILALEKQLKLVTGDNRQIEPLRAQVTELKDIEEKLKSDINILKDEYSSLKDTFQQSEIDHIQAMAEVRNECDERIHANIIKCEEDMQGLEDKFNKRIEDISEKSKEKEEKLLGEVDDVKKELADKNSELEALSAKYAALLEEKRLGEARIKALRLEKGDKFDGDAFTEKEDFDELEKELEAFVNFYDERWSKAKKKIRKKLLSYKSLKEQNRK